MELFRGTLDVLILKSLMWGPLHGYAITSFIRTQSDDALLVEEGTLYPLLRRLESQGLLVSRWQEEDKRNKRFYRLSPEGRLILKQLVAEWKRINASLDGIL